VEPWTTSFDPGTTTLQRLLELAQEVDFAAFVFARDDWTTGSAPDPDSPEPGQASPRDNVVFEAGLFGSALGMHRTFILHANDAKLPSDLLGLTTVRYDPATSAGEIRSINEKLRKAIEGAGHIARIEGDWWQFSLTERSAEEPSAVSLVRISRARGGALEVAGSGWQEDGALSVRYWSEATKEKSDPAGVFYYWNGERPRDPNAPQLYGTGEINIETSDRAAGYWTTRSDASPDLKARTSGIYLRADPEQVSVLDGDDDQQRSLEVCHERLNEMNNPLAAAQSVSPEDLFSVRIERRGDDRLDLVVSGEVDLLTAPNLESSLEGVLKSGGAQVTLDLTDVTFIDSCGLVVLISLAHRSQENGDWLRIRCGSAPVRRVIENCGADGRIPLVD
jgi:anti-anti-sigma factor